VLETLIKDRGQTFKRRHKVLESLSLKMLVAEGGFEAKLSFINPSSKGLVYLKAQVNGTNVLMLVDTGATNSFMTLQCARRLKVAVEDTALSVKVNFAQGSCQVAQVAWSVKFKAGAAKFDEDFTVCELGGVDAVLGNTFLQYYGVEVKQRPSLQIVMVGADGKPKPLPHTRVAELDCLGINLVSQQDLFEKQFVLILKEDFLDNNTKGEAPPLSYFNCIAQVLKEFGDVLTNELPNEVPPE
jgi:hypothetical protein